MGCFNDFTLLGGYWWDSHIYFICQSDSPTQACYVRISDISNHRGYADFNDDTFPRLAHPNCRHSYAILEYLIKLPPSLVEYTSFSSRTHFYVYPNAYIYLNKQWNPVNLFSFPRICSSSICQFTTTDIRYKKELSCQI